MTDIETTPIRPTTTAPNPPRQADKTPPKWSARLWSILLVACFALFLDGLDVSMVGVALPSIGADLGLSTTALQWIISGYVLGFGGLLLLGGRAGDLLGRRQVFLVALAVFAAASLMGAIVDSGTLLIVSRVIKGVAAAFTAPTAMSIITTTFKQGKDRNRALAIFSVFGASGYSCGLIFSGFLTELGWRWTFIAPVPLALGALLVGYFVIPRSKPTATGGVDLLGALTLSSGMLLAVYSLVALPEVGADNLLPLITLIAAAALLAAFFVVENRVRYPLVRLGILRNGPVARANLCIIGLFGTFLSFQFLMSIYLQSVLGWSPLQMALALAPAGILVVIISPITGRLITRYGSPRLIMVALASLSAGYVLFLFNGSSPEPNYLTDVLPSILLLGGGFAFGFSSIMAQGTDGIEDSEQGLASGLVQTSGQIGGAVVLAGVTILVTSGSHATTGIDVGWSQFQPGLILITAVALAALAVATAPLWQRNGKAGQHRLRS
ncbi:MFS transporter [Natronoglycomyces albus]|uniref:MFS transporter n=1 Tax=Natronoglycomyces albus TaxID=2811108 RepID=A0A895XRT9_9ACTN|nr:MFS transporter [Natronoglycomyces albus]QSB05895.1 MFS transporter [Natronoglycomyces albus]